MNRLNEPSKLPPYAYKQCGMKFVGPCAISFGSGLKIEATNVRMQRDLPDGSRVISDLCTGEVVTFAGGELN